VIYCTVTVVEEIELEDLFQAMAAQMLKQAAAETADIAGNGTISR
jgi:chaperonin GroEL (HSP60 family)